ncbi:MAG: benzoate/H(+) symporter BenE family transporter [Brachybacterium sp.]|nr:benzoate/H(+) symporter BenE family transporter [Brachybacterium sp.]
MPAAPSPAPVADAPGRTQPILVGITTALVGFTSSFAVVLAGLRAVGASLAQATTGLIVLCAVIGLATLWLSTRHRMPITLAWSTPGAAVLVAAGAIGDGWPSAVGAFIVVGALLVATALVPGLGRLVQGIPGPVAHAMLAGVLLTICLQAVTALVALPLLVGPVVLLWLVLVRFAPRWSTPLAFAAALVIAAGVAVADGRSVALQAPAVTPTLPTFSVAALVGIAIPLWVVTVASQHVPGTAVMASFGFRVPWKETLVVTGAGTALGAAGGAHTINLAAITAALPASDEAHPEAERRWVAAHTAGWTYLVLALLVPVLTGLAADAPDGLTASVAGLALLGTLGASLSSALAIPERRLPAVAAFLVAASGVVLGGVGATFWALVTGMLLWWLLAPSRRQSA